MLMATNSRWDNVIVTMDILQPDKKDSLAYLDENGPTPDRYARATLQFNSQEEPYIQEYMIGPLPLSNATGQHKELNHIFTSGRGRTRVYNADSEAIAAFNLEVGTQIKKITKDLLNGVSSA